MIPGPWVSVVLVLAIYRVCRLAGWDTFPPVARARAWVVGENTVTRGSTNARLGVTAEPVQNGWTYRRPLLHELVTCPFCLSLWIAGAVYALWLFFPAGVLYGAYPFALSAAAGLIAKNLDP